MLVLKFNRTMAINASCPISYDLVNEKLTRIYSVFTFISLLVYVATPYKWFLLISAFDFIIRVTIGVKYSPICFIIKQSLFLLNTKPHLVNAEPKKFAAKIGLAFTVSMSALYLLQMLEIFGLTLGVFSLKAVGAEVFFKYCIACKIYRWFVKS